jgi:glycine/D-amino acid oxidase-like deaminating enzyme
VHAFAREHNIPCDLYSGDTVDIIYDQAQWDTSVKSIAAMREAMPDELDSVARYTIWSNEEAREKFFVKGEECIGAVSYEAGSLSAYKFVIGVLKLCLKAGLELYTNTPATSVDKEVDGRWKVETPKGVVMAGKVVLATNGYTGFLSERFGKIIVPLRGQITAHRPGSNMPKEGLPVTYSFIYKNGYEYMIPRPQGSKFAGDIIMGGGLVKAKDEGIDEFGTTDDTSINQEISTYLTETTPRYFGENWGKDDKEGRIRREWTGIMGYSSDGFPFVGEVSGEVRPFHCYAWDIACQL